MILPNLSFGNCVLLHDADYFMYQDKQKITVRTMMNYKNIKKGIFINRENRFIANVFIDQKQVVTHVKNTGRCKELLTDNCTVFLEESDQLHRKTKYDLVAVVKENQIFNMDSQAPNHVVKEWLEQGNLVEKNSVIVPEKKYKDSRMDFYIETKTKKIFMEVKGVTLEKNKIAYFPDAPTTRGIKHIEHLIKMREEGYETYLFFVIAFEGAICFRPNDQTHPEFGMALRKAKQAGVHLLAYDCKVTETSLQIHQPIDIDLKEMQ